MAKYLTYNGETHNYNEWARLLGLNQNTLNARLKYGWSIERVLSSERYKCGKKPRRVRCIETGVIYNSTNECADDFFIEPHNIRNNCCGRTKSCAGFHFEYVKD